MKRILFALPAVALFALLARTVFAQAILPTGFSDQTLATGLDFPTSMAPLPDGRVLTTEKNAGRIRLMVNDALIATPVGIVDSVHVSPGEGGLLGVAVDPGFPSRPYVYVQYDYSGGPFIRISRYTVSGDLAFTGNGTFQWDNASRYDVMSDLQDSISVHNGGTLRFGPDGMLYSSVGNDETQCKAVYLNQLIGKILRLDVSQLPDGPGGPAPLALLTPPDNPFVNDSEPRARLVWEKGLRNPYSYQIDASTGDLYIADVGDVTYEELDLADSPRLDFGYPAYEGPQRTPFSCPDQPMTGIIFPIYYYDRTDFQFGASIVTAGLYHRPASGAARFPAEYEGDCFLSDVGEGFLRRLKRNGNAWAIAPPVAGQPADSDWAQNMDGVTDYFVAGDGSLWYCKYSERAHNLTGEIHRIIANQATAADELTRLDFESPRPLPARGAVSLAWTLSAPARVTLTIHDVAGRELRRLVDEPEGAGRHEHRWDGRDRDGRRAAPGVYFARLRAGPEGAIGRLVLLE